MAQKDIAEILKEVGIDIPEDKTDSFNKEFRTNYKSVGEISKITADRDDYKKKYEDLSNSLEGDNGLNTKISQLTQERDDYKSKFETANNELILEKGKIKVSTAGVSKDFIEFVASKVNSQVNDKTDFDTVLKNYIKENPQYLEGSKVKVRTALSFNGGNPDKTNTNQLMNNAILSAVGKNK